MTSAADDTRTNRRRESCRTASRSYRARCKAQVSSLEEENKNLKAKLHLITSRLNEASSVRTELRARVSHTRKLDSVLMMLSARMDALTNTIYSAGRAQQMSSPPPPPFYGHGGGQGTTEHTTSTTTDNSFHILGGDVYGAGGGYSAPPAPLAHNHSFGVPMPPTSHYAAAAPLPATAASVPSGSPVSESEGMSPLVHSSEEDCGSSASESPHPLGFPLLEEGALSVFGDLGNQEVDLPLLGIETPLAGALHGDAFGIL